MRTKQLIHRKWVFNDDANREPQIGDKITFLCNGRGRGGHYSVSMIVSKVNKKTIDGVEASRSYRPGTLWRIAKDSNDARIELPQIGE